VIIGILLILYELFTGILKCLAHSTLVPTEVSVPVVSDVDVIILIETLLFVLTA
jgi:hypothetical protein